MTQQPEMLDGEGLYPVGDYRRGLQLIAREECDEVAASYYAKKALAVLSLAAAPQPDHGPKTAAEIIAICRAWRDADDPSHWGAFEHALDAALKASEPAK